MFNVPRRTWIGRSQIAVRGCMKSISYLLSRSNERPAELVDNIRSGLRNTKQTLRFRRPNSFQIRAISTGFLKHCNQTIQTRVGTSSVGVSETEWVLPVQTLGNYQRH
jgi:hypothetical protein